jgi:gliding motility-associated lipoprotein GldD
MKTKRTIGNRQLTIANKISDQSGAYIKKLACCLLPIVCFILTSCNSEYVAKPRGYFKIELPPKKYQLFDDPGFPYSFEYPVYAEIIQDSLFFEEKSENPYWINIDFPRFNGRIHISYKEIGRNKFDSLVNDAFTMSYKQHTYKASKIDQKEFTTPNGSGGVYFSLKGNTATANQFFITDSVKHFLRGALYFSATPNADSLHPVNQFLKQDVEQLINTLKWK